MALISREKLSETKGQKKGNKKKKSQNHYR